MSHVSITLPDGRTADITHPENATTQEIQSVIDSVVRQNQATSQTAQGVRKPLSAMEMFHGAGTQEGVEEVLPERGAGPSDVASMIAGMAIPAGGTLAGVKAVTKAVDIARQPWTRVGRVAEVAKAVGRPTNVAERLATGPRAVNEAYNAARAVEARVPTGGLREARAAALDDPTLNEVAKNLLTKQSWFGADVPYGSVVSAQQKLSNAMNTFKRSDPNTWSRLNNVRKAYIGEATKVNPALQNANRLNAYTEASELVLRIVEAAPNPGKALSSFNNLISKDKSVLGGLGLEGKPEAIQLLQNAIQRGVDPAHIDTLIRALTYAAVGGALGAVGYHFLGRSEGWGGGGG